MNRSTLALCLAAAFAGTLCLSQSFAQQPAAPAPAPAPAAQPAAPSFKFEASADHKDAIYKLGEKAKFSVRLLGQDGKPVEGAKIDYSLKGDFGLAAKGSLTSSEAPAIVEASLDKPGFVLLSLAFTPEGSKDQIKGLAGAGFDPLQIKAQRPEPADFDQFWDKAKAELAAVPLKFTLTPVDVPDNFKGKVDCFDVKADCAGGLPVSAYLARPVDAKRKSLPAIISYHGAGVRSSGKPLGKAAQGFLAMDVNAHGLDNGKPDAFYKELADGALKDYRNRDANDASKIYFRGMYLRVLRALEVLKAQPEWDGRILVTTGTSQGGGQSLVAAALDPQVTFCQANVPALCFHTGILDGQESGWPRFVKLVDGKPADQAVVDAVPYYDASIFAKRIKCPSLLSTGFIDVTCAPTSVYVAFNNIPASDKRIINDIPCGHGVPKETYIECDKAVLDYVKKAQAAAK